MGASLQDRATTAEPTISALRDGIPSAKKPYFDVREASPKQIGAILGYLTDLIGIYSETVRNAQERYEKDCAFLADLMAEFTRITQHIVADGARAFERPAQGMEARSGETGTDSTESATPNRSGDAG